MRGNPFFIALVLTLGCTLTAPCVGRDRLSPYKATQVISAYEGVIENCSALFPSSVSEALPTDSLGPRMVTKACLAGWRETYRRLVEEGFLSSFEEEGSQIGFAKDSLTPEGKRFFSRLTSESFYLTVAVISLPQESNVRSVVVKQEPGAKKAVATFEASPTPAFSILFENKVFEAGCGGEVDKGVEADGKTLRGHVHFRFRSGAWTIERIMLGSHTLEE